MPDLIVENGHINWELDTCSCDEDFINADIVNGYGKVFDGLVEVKSALYKITRVKSNQACASIVKNWLVKFLHCLERHYIDKISEKQSKMIEIMNSATNVDRLIESH